MMIKMKPKKKLSLQEAFPSLAKEWHPNKNEMLTPKDVRPNDDIQVWWKCSLKHEWIATVKDRVDGAVCPHCPPITKPFPKMITLAEDQPDAVKFWHPKKNGNRTPHQFSKQSGNKVWWKCEKGHEWFAAIGSMRYKPHCPLCYPGPGTSATYNLAVKYPELALQWHPTKNGELLPTQVTPNSSKEVWWKCSNGHDWKSTVVARQHRRHCPRCSDKKLDSTNNLAVLSPQVVPFWHPTKNGGRPPSDFKPKSPEKVWWVCEKGHEFQRIIVYMEKSQNCPVCRRIYIDETLNLLAQNPELVKEWHPVKNGTLTPDKVRPHSPLKIWWLCPKGHEYQASVGNRNRPSKGRGCPYCSGRKDLSKESLAILHPELAQEWHPKKNGALTPEKVSTVNKHVVWWKCKKGHEWEDVIFNRVYTAKGRTCPYCNPA